MMERIEMSQSRFEIFASNPIGNRCFRRKYAAGGLNLSDPRELFKKKKGECK
jgi:hypothetical protein